MTGWRSRFSGFDGLDEAPKGTLEEWRSAANMLFAAGCEPQAFVLLASLAAPLMALLPKPEGGAFVSIHGGRRAGKSVALSAAGSVWGATNACQQQPNLPHFPAALTNTDPEIAGRVVRSYMLQMDPTITINVSSTALKDVLPQHTHDLILEFPLHVPRLLIAPDKQTPSVLERRLLDNRGQAAVVWAGRLGMDAVWAKKKLVRCVGDVVDLTGAGEPQRFWVRAIAGVWIAGLMAVESGLLECTPERIARWAMSKAFPEKVKP